jgi:hypothetical protein
MTEHPITVTVERAALLPRFDDVYSECDERLPVPPHQVICSGKSGWPRKSVRVRTEAYRALTIFPCECWWKKHPNRKPDDEFLARAAKWRSELPRKAVRTGKVAA